MKLYCSYEKPEHHQAANSSQTPAHFFMYYMLFQINHPGTVHALINTVTTLVCKISHKNIFRFHQSADISQQHAYQNYPI